MTAPRADSLIARLAATQHGVVSAPQLRAAGVTRTAIANRVAAGRLHRVHRAVFAVGHPLLSMHGRWMAAVLACGPRALLSHRSAAALWELRRSERSGIDVLVPGRASRARPGIHAHSTRFLAGQDRAGVRGIPCTSVARTLLDLAEVVDRRALERACNQADILRALDDGALGDVLARARGRRGASTLRSVLADGAAADTLTRSELEERFLALCAAAGVPRPTVNAWVPLTAAEGDGLEVDFFWPDRRLVVETDGRAVHGTRDAFQRGRRRDQRLAVAGFHVIRFTWDQVTRRPQEVSGVLRRLLDR